MRDTDLEEAIEIIQEYRAGVVRRQRGFSRLYLKATKLIEDLGLDPEPPKEPTNLDFTESRKSYKLRNARSEKTKVPKNPHR